MSKSTETKVIKYIEREGLLLESDPKATSLVSLVVGAPIKGSWWGHEKGNQIYNLSGAISERSDILTMKFISGKVTFVHKFLFDDIFSVIENEQKKLGRGISISDQQVLKQVKKKGCVRADQIVSKIDLKQIRKSVKELEKRLLIFTESVHIESGKHEKFLWNWNYLCQQRQFGIKEKNPVEAKSKLEALVKQINERFDSKHWLPWQKYK